MTSPQNTITVNIWSDIACPWCYIGKRKFESALKEYRESDNAAEVSVEYHSYQLSPDVPVGFEGDQLEYLSKNKGMPLEQVKQMVNQVSSVAKTVGLDYDMDSVKMTNTQLAHELLHFAKSKGKQHELKERLMSAFFVEGGRVGNAESLADYAAEIGLDRAEALEAMNAHQFEDAFKADVAQARAFGINGVPFFVFNEKYGVSGAQDSSTFLQVLNQVASDTAEEA
ncbi:MAG: DsbA family oxidoreductase [Microbacteriaceae bacterium]